MIWFTAMAAAAPVRIELVEAYVGRESRRGTARVDDAGNVEVAFPGALTVCLAADGRRYLISDDLALVRFPGEFATDGTWAVAARGRATTALGPAVSVDLAGPSAVRIVSLAERSPDAAAVGRALACTDFGVPAAVLDAAGDLGRVVRVEVGDGALELGAPSPDPGGPVSLPDLPQVVAATGTPIARPLPEEDVVGERLAAMSETELRGLLTGLGVVVAQCGFTGDVRTCEGRHGPDFVEVRLIVAPTAREAVERHGLFLAEDLSPTRIVGRTTLRVVATDGTAMRQIGGSVARAGSSVADWERVLAADGWNVSCFDAVGARGCHGGRQAERGRQSVSVEWHGAGCAFSAEYRWCEQNLAVLLQDPGAGWSWMDRVLAAAGPTAPP